MGQRSPLVTLAATAVGLVALLVVNSTQTGSPTATDTAADTQHATRHPWFAPTAPSTAARVRPPENATP